MEVILLEKITRLGGVGDVVKVRDGYGRNFLIPQSKAMRATKANVAEFEAKRESLVKYNEQMRVKAEADSKAFENISVKIVRQASEDGKLFGSVTVRDVATALEAAGHNIERRCIDLNSTVKTLGRYKVSVSLHPEVRVNVNVDVVRTLETPVHIEEEVVSNEENVA